MSVSDFHTQRQMFAIFPYDSTPEKDVLSIAPPFVDMDQCEWIEPLFGGVPFQTIFGFEYQGNLFFYTAVAKDDDLPGFDGHDNPAFKFLPRLQRLFNLPFSAFVYSGFVRGEPGKLWESITSHGSLSQVYRFPISVPPSWLRESPTARTISARSAVITRQMMKVKRFPPIIATMDYEIIDGHTRAVVSEDETVRVLFRGA